MRANRSEPSSTPGVVVRRARATDRISIGELGHPPPVPALLCPPVPRRIVWRLLGTRAFTVVAEEAGSESMVGAVQFVRARSVPGTWMFGHWRVASSRRRQGIGRRLLEEGRRFGPDVRRLYSYVEWDNQVSMEAHERLGFESGRTLRGRAPLGALSTLGPSNPSLRLEPVGADEWPVLYSIYARAMESLWLRLFPGLGPRDLADERPRGLRAGAVAVARGTVAVRTGAASRDSDVAGFVLWEGSRVTLFADPRACDAGLLARVALQIIAHGAPREQVLELRGLPRSLGARPGPLWLQAVMGMPDVSLQWGD